MVHSNIRNNKTCSPLCVVNEKSHGQSGSNKAIKHHSLVLCGTLLMLGGKYLYQLCATLCVPWWHAELANPFPLQNRLFSSNWHHSCSARCWVCRTYAWTRQHFFIHPSLRCAAVCVGGVHLLAMPLKSHIAYAQYPDPCIKQPPLTASVLPMQPRASSHGA